MTSLIHPKHLVVMLIFNDDLFLLFKLWHGRTDGPTDGPTDRRTDGPTDGRVI